VFHPRGDAVGRHDDARLRAAQDREDRVPVRGVDVGVRLRALRRRVELRDLGSDRGQETEGEGRRSQQAEDGQQGKESELTDATAFRPAAISPEERQNRGSLARVVPESAASDLTSHAVDVLPDGGLEAKLKLGRPLRVKLGVDPTSPDVHLGFAYVLERLADFQREGHQIVLIVGDYTARIGDPSGLSKERPILADEVLDANAQYFAEQAFRILDRDRTEVRLNGEWLGALSYADTVRLARTMTVARLLERDDFAKRFAGHVPISLSELLYPIMQAYDSVAIEADVEIGGTDQRFNLLAGRDVMPQYGLEPQVVVTFPLLVGTDGELKMSKSRGNYIGITDPPEEMFGKTMSIPDGALPEWWEMLVGGDHPDEPMAWKLELARRITARWHGAEGAEVGEEHFTRVVRRHEAPADVPDVRLPAGDPVHLPALLVEGFGVGSTSEARRLIQQGAVKVDGEPASGLDLPRAGLAGAVVQVGKRRFGRLTG
jgi:tyrosyl-tRNA synthetase